MMLRTRKRALRVVGGVTTCLAVLLVAAACGGSSGALRSALTDGVQEARLAMSGYVDDFAVLGRKSAITIPPRLDDAVRQADDAVRYGAALTAEERALLNTGEEWVVAFKKLDDILRATIGWETNIPDDAVRLVNARLIAEPSPAFAEKVNELERKVLKGLRCQVARDALDEAGKSQADAATADYAAVGSSDAEVAAFLEHELAGFQSVSDVLDVAGLAVDSIVQHNTYVQGVNDIIESPDGVVAAANVIYFKSCILA